MQHCQMQGNYNTENKCRVFKLPKDPDERQTWLSCIPPRLEFEIDFDKFFICERHWPAGYPEVKIPGGSTRPVVPPSVFVDVPKSCLPTPKAPPRPPKDENKQLSYFLQMDKIPSFESFSPEQEMGKNTQTCFFLVQNSDLYV